MNMNNMDARALGMIVIGGVSFLGMYLGYHQIWFVFPLVVGLCFLLVPARSKEGALELTRRRQTGFWSLAVGTISGLVFLTSLTWGQVGPFFMIAAGLYGILFHRDRLFSQAGTGH